MIKEWRVKIVIMSVLFSLLLSYIYKLLSGSLSYMYTCCCCTLFPIATYCFLLLFIDDVISMLCSLFFFLGRGHTVRSGSSKLVRVRLVLNQKCIKGSKICIIFPWCFLISLPLLWCFDEDYLYIQPVLYLGFIQIHPIRSIHPIQIRSIEKSIQGYINIVGGYKNPFW